MLIDNQHRLEVLDSEIDGFSSRLYRANHLKEDDVLIPYAQAHFPGILRGDAIDAQGEFNRKRQTTLDEKLKAQIEYTAALNLALRLMRQTSTHSAEHESELQRLKRRFKTEASKASTKALTSELTRWHGTKVFDMRMRALSLQLADAGNPDLMRLPGSMQSGALMTVENSLFIQMENVLDSKIRIATLNKLDAEQNAGFVAACALVQQPLSGKQRDDRLFAAEESERYARADITATSGLLTKVNAYAQVGRSFYLN